MFSFNEGLIDRAIASALSDLVDVLSAEANALMTENRWDWPNVTHRKNGEIVTSPRNIYDTGELFKSQRSWSTGDNAEILYDCDYAAEVHADRPWLETAAIETDIEAVFAKSLRKNL
jgi:hypothetical protein